MYTTLNHITGDCMLSELELKEIEANAVASMEATFNFQDYIDALDHADSCEQKAFVKHRKAHNAEAMGALVLRLIDAYALMCAEPNIDEITQERERELRGRL